MKVGHSTRISVEAAKAWREAGKAATNARAKPQRQGRSKHAENAEA